MFENERIGDRDIVKDARQCIKLEVKTASTNGKEKVSHVTTATEIEKVYEHTPDGFVNIGGRSQEKVYECHADIPLEAKVQMDFSASKGESAWFFAEQDPNKSQIAYVVSEADVAAWISERPSGFAPLELKNIRIISCLPSVYEMEEQIEFIPRVLINAADATDASDENNQETILILKDPVTIPTNTQNKPFPREQLTAYGLSDLVKKYKDTPRGTKDVMGKLNELHQQILLKMAVTTSSEEVDTQERSRGTAFRKICESMCQMLRQGQ